MDSGDRAIEGAVDVFRTLAEETRIRIVLALAQHPEISVGELVSTQNLDSDEIDMVSGAFKRLQEDYPRQGEVAWMRWILN